MVYNVVNQAPVTADEVFAYLQSNGSITERLPLDEWKSRLQETADREDDLELKVLLQSLESVEGYLTDPSVYDISRFSEAIMQIGLPAPTVDLQYVTRFLRVQ